ncbi:MAG: BrxA/BrxB family bacilliredoxin [Longimicrobiaceae bacterium]
MYSELMVRPMRQELTTLGVEELKTPAEVDQALEKRGTTLVVVNSVCGCAARNARPAVAIALGHHSLPDQCVTVFAGMDREATGRAREHLSGYPPSSPSIALLKDGEVAFMLERNRIEGRSAEQIAGDLTQAFDEYCNGGRASSPSVGKAEH